MTIEVEERAEKPGRCVAVANIGAALAVFAIHVDGGEVHYYIEDVEVPRQAYVDAMKTAELDRYCPGCMGEDEADSAHGAC